MKDVRDCADPNEADDRIPDGASMDEIVSPSTYAKAKEVKRALIRQGRTSWKVEYWVPDITGALQSRLERPDLQCNQVKKWIDEIPDCDTVGEAVEMILELDDVQQWRVMTG